MYITIQQEISDELWVAVSKNYELENYSGAILDSIFLFSKLIREKSDSDLDGIALVGKVFGGTEPMLKINRFRTDSEKNEQKGFENILRGIYQGIRNPRAHEKIEDTKTTCDSLLLFLNYLLSILNRAKSKFEIDDFCERVFDTDFVESNEYAKLLCDEIPDGKQYDVLLEIINRRAGVSPTKYYYIFTTLSSLISAQQQEDIIAYVNDILKTSIDDSDIRLFTIIFQGEKWETLNPAARMRTENKLIKSMGKGEYDIRKNKCKDGSLGTWITNISRNLKLKAEYRSVILKKINSDKYEELEYLFRYFKSEIIPNNIEPEESLITGINKALLKGDKRMYDLIQWDVMILEDKWIEKVRDAFDNFSQKQLYEDPNDLPF